VAKKQGGKTISLNIDSKFLENTASNFFQISRNEKTGLASNKSK
jgi:hypothetical protein